MPRNILLLTATITTLHGLPCNARSDPKVRRRDYREALEHYLPMIGPDLDGLIFAENSAADLGEFRGQAEAAGVGDRVDLISFEGLDYPGSYGKGYGEFKLVDHAMAESRLIREWREDVVVWKCTGRYRIRNFPALIRRRPADAGLYCNCRNYPKRICDLYLMAWTMPAYEEFIRGCYEHLINHTSRGFDWEEVHFRRRIDSMEHACKVVRRFRDVPLIDGYRGFDNVAYLSSPLALKVMTRRVARMLVPWIWI